MLSLAADICICKLRYSPLYLILQELFALMLRLLAPMVGTTRNQTNNHPPGKAELLALRQTHKLACLKESICVRVHGSRCLHTICYDNMLVVCHDRILYVMILQAMIWYEFATALGPFTLDGRVRGCVRLSREQSRYLFLTTADVARLLAHGNFGTGILGADGRHVFGVGVVEGARCHCSGIV